MNKMRIEKEKFNQKLHRLILICRTTSNSTTKCAPTELIFSKRLKTAMDNQIYHAGKRKMKTFKIEEEVFGQSFRLLSGVIAIENGPLNGVVKGGYNENVMQHADHL